MRTPLQATLLVAGLLTAPTGAWAIGNALSFDAARSSYVQVPRAVSDDFTIEFWVRTSMTGPTGTLWWQGAGLVDGEMAGAVNDFGVVLLNGKAAFGIGNPDVTIQSTTTINDGQWHHIAATRLRSSGLMLLYVDGVQEASSAGITTNTASLTAPTNLRLGSIRTGTPAPAAFFTGQLDEVRLWSTVRTATEIGASKNYLVPSGTAGLAAYYRLDEGTGTTTNGTGAGAAGTLSNSPTWVVPSSAPIYGVPAITSLSPGSAVVGSSVVIRGSNFTGATSVLFNGTAAAFTVNADGQITATVPVGATSGTISVVGPVATATGTGTSGSSFAVLPHLMGTVFDDVNYGGGAGRSLATATSSASNFTNLGRPNATVELYLNGALAATTTTDASGVYRFYNLDTGTYTVRVVSSTVSSSRTGSATAGLLPVVTYQGTTTDQVGGLNPALPDAPANSGSQTLAALTTGTQAVQALAAASVSSTGSTTGIDFGFNFDLVVNTKASGQGSLAQFIVNSNALGDESKLAQAGSFLNEIVGANATGTALPAATETSLFMVPDGAAHAGLRAANATPAGPANQLSGGVAVISPTGTAGLPAISGPATVINGWTQTFNIGNTNSRLLGTGGPTGVNNVVLPQLNAPEVQLTGTAATNVGLDLTGAGSGAMGLAIYGFGSGTANDSYANVRVAADNVTVLGNFIGSPATAFTSGGTKADGIRVLSGTGLTVQNNLIAFHQGKGLTTNSGVTGATISQNEVRGNATADLTLGGIDVQGSASMISNNLVINNLGAGLDGLSSAGSNTWTGNTVTGNGAGSTSITTIPRNSAGIRVYGAGNTVSLNVITNNYGAGIMVNAGATKSVISQNSIYGNGSGAATNGNAASGQVGIDLLTTANNNASVGTQPYVTTNSTSTAGANALVNYPLLKTASLLGTTLTVRGLVTTDRTVELFLATPNTVALPSSTTGNNFGQGSSYLGSVSVTRTDSVTAYSGNVNGFAQGSGSGVPFSARLSLTSLTADQRAALAAGGAQLTATATAASLGTSEFSGIVTVATAPTAYAVTNLKTAAGTSTNNPAVALNPGLTSPQAANDPASTIASYTVQPATSGTLAYDGNPVTAATVVPAANTNKLTFKPTVGFTGNATFTFTAKNAAGTSSNAATYTIPVVNSNSFVANDDGLDAKQNTATAGNVVLNDLNPANTTSFTATLVAGPTRGTLTLRADGSYTYTPNSGISGADSFTYKVCATATDCSNTATVAINVYDPNTVCSAATGPNLLQNPGFEAGNDGSFTSAYTFVDRLKADGTPNSDGLQPETTYAVDTDANYYHSNFRGLGRGGSGKFMIVNGAANQSKVYSQVVTVIPDRYYTFSGWAQSVNPSSPAILGFVINGKSASVSTTLNATANNYTQFSGVWYSGTSRTATFEVRDINRASGGNDFGLDDVYFGTCSVNLQAVTKTQSPSVPYGGAPTNLDALDATLVNSGASVASFVVQTVPAEGILRLGSPTGTLIVPGQVIPYAQRGAVYYVANGNANTMTTSFTYTAVDSEGAGSNNTATYTIPMAASPLPVVLATFTARPSGTSALLDWTTASEKNNAHFSVERSRTGQPADFVAIGQLAGQGTTAAAHTYRFSDPNAAATGSTVYYRLRQVDADGSATYSPVRAVSFGLAASAGSLALFPNPVAEASTTLDLSPLPATATYQVRLLDATGRATRQWALPGGQAQSLDLGSLVPGSYLLLVSGQRADGTTLRQVLHLTKE